MITECSAHAHAIFKQIINLSAELNQLGFFVLVCPPCPSTHPLGPICVVG